MPVFGSIRGLVGLDSACEALAVLYCRFKAVTEDRGCYYVSWPCSSVVIDLRVGVIRSRVMLSLASTRPVRLAKFRLGGLPLLIAFLPEFSFENVWSSSLTVEVNLRSFLPDVS